MIATHGDLKNIGESRIFKKQVNISHTHIAQEIGRIKDDCYTRRLEAYW